MEYNVVDLCVDKVMCHYEWTSDAFPVFISEINFLETAKIERKQ